MRDHKLPDLNAPRFRLEAQGTLNSNMYHEIVALEDKLINVPFSLFKKINLEMNTQMSQLVVDNRDGLKLPEQLGFLFIGSCGRNNPKNINFHKSKQLGYNVQNQNWESDQFLAKIFYTNYETKYRFLHHDLWGFTACRTFKRNVAHTYPLQWQKYLSVIDFRKISVVFAKRKTIDCLKNRDVNLMLQYDEFKFD